MGNEEMGKWEEGTLHFTQQTADVLLLQSSMSITTLHFSTASFKIAHFQASPTFLVLFCHICLNTN